MSDLQRFEFEGKPLTVIEYKGEPVWMAREVGELLGYADGSRLQRKINGDWSEEFLDGKDVLRIKGEDLADFRELVGPDSGLSKARALMLLTESGINLAAMKTNKPVGRKLRRWLASDVLPAIRRTGSYSAPSPAQVESPDARERRLMLREERLAAQMRAKYLTQTADWLEAHDGAGAASRRLRSMVVEVVVGREVPELLPAVEPTLLKAGEVAGMLNAELGETVITGNRVGKWARELGIYQTDGFGQSTLDKSAHSDSLHPNWRYNDAGVDRLRERAREAVAGDELAAARKRKARKAKT